MSNFLKVLYQLTEGSHQDEEDARTNGVTLSRTNKDSVATVEVKAVNSKGVVIMTGTMEYVIDFLKRKGITKIKYNNDLDKYNSKDQIKKSAKAMKDKQDASGYTKRREEIWGKK